MSDQPKYPGELTATDGSGAIVAMETAASDAAGAYPITPSTQMGEGWAVAVAKGERNVNGRRLIFFEPEGEHAAAGVTAGMSLMGLRATNFSSGQGIAYMHESLYAATGKRLTYVLNMACRAMTKHTLNVHAGHDDYHAVDDTGFFQVFAKDVQASADLNLISHRIAELSLNPGICAQDGFLTSHVIETVRMPERALIKEFLGDGHDVIETPTPAQRTVFGDTRRRIPELYDLDYPSMLGVVQNQDSYAQGVAAQRPFYFDHIPVLTDQAFEEFFALTGRRYARAQGYRLDDAEWVIVGQGSVVSNAEAVVDWLRAERGLKVGVLDVTMFRPFPADLVTRLLKGKRGAVVLERLDQPLAVDAPVLRELRAAMGKAVENHRAKAEVHEGVDWLAPEQVPFFYSACFGMGSRDLQPGDIVAAVEHMLDGAGRRQFYLGLDFVRPNTRMPKLQILQDELTTDYKQLEALALPRVPTPNLMPEGAVSIRIHSVGGWGAITMGKNLTLTAGELFGLHVKANPKYGSEKKGQPTTFYATLAPAPVRLNCELKHVDVVLAPDPNVMLHSNALAGLEAGGVFVIQSDLDEQALWNSLPPTAQREIREKGIKVFHLDAFKIASEESSNEELRYRMQGTAFLGAFFHATSLMDEHGLDEESLLEGLRKQLAKKFGHLGDRVVDDNLRVIQRGFDELKPLPIPDVDASTAPLKKRRRMPVLMSAPAAEQGPGNPARFWEQVGQLHMSGEDGIADPFAAMGAIPAASSSMRDMTDMRFEIPEFIADKCTGCSQCWVQCPDSAIPGVVNSVEEVFATGVSFAENGKPLNKARQLLGPLAKEAHKLLKNEPFTTFGAVAEAAVHNVAGKLEKSEDKRQALAGELAPVVDALREFPFAKTAPFYDLPERKEKGTGGLLSVTVNPQTCKGCMLCVDVCDTGALIRVRQTDDNLQTLRRNWDLWQQLPETSDRYVNVASLEEGVGTLSSMLLQQSNYFAMLGGDGACMGCGEKTVLHMVLAANSALMLPRVKAHIAELGELIDALEERARGLLAADTKLEDVAKVGGDKVGIELGADKRGEIELLAELQAALKDLHWRYTEGPTGHGRATAGLSNSTGCSSVWASTYPYNPYPFPWVNHLFQDAPSVAIGLFEGNMRKMAEGFAAVRRARLVLAGEYDAERDEPLLSRLDWHDFTDEEFRLSPPIFAVGGDGAMLDIGFQNLSRLLASGKPLRVVVLDTQVYSNTGGQACTSGFTGQVSDMAAYGQAQHGKTETRKELALLGIAHRNTYVLQSSQASGTHLIGGVLRGLQARRPAVFILHAPCPPEHGIPDDGSQRHAKMTLEGRAFPFVVFDPDAGESLSECIDLDGNPAPEDDWPEYELSYLDDNDERQVLTLPFTTADWAATEGRFKRHFTPLADDDDDVMPFHELVALPVAERASKRSFIYSLDQDGRLGRVLVSDEVVELAADRQHFWSQLRQLAGMEVAPDIASDLKAEAEAEFDKRAAALAKQHEEEMEALKRSYPGFVAQRLAKGLVRASAKDGSKTLNELLTSIEAMTDIIPVTGELAAHMIPEPANGGARVAAAPAAAPVEAKPATAPAPEPEAPPATDDDDDDDDELSLGAYIESERCTSCNDCLEINKKMFAYDENKHAYIKDASAGTFKQMVQAAEKCPARIIHPGSPLNPNEKDLDKWVARAQALFE
jgi:pyruvate-ferredoxin/flavodoxin oxidoreductase